MKKGINYYGLIKKNFYLNMFPRETTSVLLTVNGSFITGPAAGSPGVPNNVSCCLSRTDTVVLPRGQVFMYHESRWLMSSIHVHRGLALPEQMEAGPQTLFIASFSWGQKLGQHRWAAPLATTGNTFNRSHVITAVKTGSFSLWPKASLGVTET